MRQTRLRRWPGECASNYDITKMIDAGFVWGFRANLVYFSAKRGKIMAERIIRIAITTRTSTKVIFDNAFMLEPLSSTSCFSTRIAKRRRI